MRTLIAAAALLLLPAPVGVAMSSSCPATASMTTGCVRNSNSSVTVTATQTQTAPAPRSDSSPTLPQRNTPTPEADPCTTGTDSFSRSCGMYAARIESPDGDPLTITDLARFAPGPVAATSEPAGVGVAGMPTNFVAPAAVHTRTGSVLDLPATVRFTPVGFDFVYGDGATTTTTTGGQSWASLHQAQFTPTTTSHTYRERGTFTAQVTVRYTADVDLGNGWFPVAGELAIPGSTQSIRGYEATTALVAHTCTAASPAPGC